MRKWQPYLVLPFAAWAGYLIPRDPDASYVDTEFTPPANGSNLQQVSKTILDSERIHLITAKIAEDDDYREVAETIALSDIPAVMSQLLSQAGPRGLPYQSLNAISKMITRWAKEDYHGALTWARSHPNRTAAGEFVELVITQSNDEDFDTTLATIRDVIQIDGLQIDLAEKLFNKAANHGARQAFELLATVPNPKGITTQYLEVDFPAGFDFRTFAEMSLEHYEKPKSDGFRRFPTNLLRDWLLRDKSTALNFFSTKSLPFNDLSELSDNELEFFGLTRNQVGNSE